MSIRFGRSVVVQSTAPTALARRQPAALRLGDIDSGSRMPQRRSIFIGGERLGAPSPAAVVSADSLPSQMSGSYTAAAGYRRMQRVAFSAGVTGKGSEEETKAEHSVKVKVGVMPGAFDNVEIDLLGGDDEDKDKEDRSPKPGDDNLDRSTYTREVEFLMPDLGEAGEDDGVVVKWYKKEGDIIRTKDALCDIQTKLFEFSMESDDEQVTVMGKINVPEGSDPVEPGDVLCVILHEDRKKEEESSSE